MHKRSTPVQNGRTTQTAARFIHSTQSKCEVETTSSSREQGRDNVDLETEPACVTSVHVNTTPMKYQSDREIALHKALTHTEVHQGTGPRVESEHSMETVTTVPHVVVAIRTYKMVRAHPQHKTTKYKS